MGRLAIPATIDQVTPEWLSSVLNAPVRSIDVRQVGVGVGIMGTIHKIDLTYATPTAGAPATVVVKQAATAEANREQGVALGLYTAEVRFYRELASKTKLRVPQVFHADLDDDMNFVIVMEDLSGLQNLDQITGMTTEQVRHAVVSLADLHGPYFGKVAELEWIPSVVHPRIEMFAGVYPMLWNVVKERFASVLDADRLAVGDAIAEHYLSVMKRLGERPWTLLHMDFRCDNFLFDPATPADPIVTLDWQSLGRGPGVYDLAYLLGGSITLADRRANEDALLHAYHDRLVANGVTNYPFTELVEDYRLASLVGPGSAVLVGGGLDMGNERGVALISSMVERHVGLAADLRAIELIGG
jgi:hypothetical protein